MDEAVDLGALGASLSGWESARKAASSGRRRRRKAEPATFDLGGGLVASEPVERLSLREERARWATFRVGGDFLWTGRVDPSEIRLVAAPGPVSEATRKALVPVARVDSLFEAWTLGGPFRGNEKGAPAVTYAREGPGSFALFVREGWTPPPGQEELF